MAETTGKRLISFEELKPRKGIAHSKTTVWRAERDGKFPKRVHPTERTVAWIEDELDAWISQRIAERDGAQAEEKVLITQHVDKGPQEPEILQDAPAHGHEKLRGPTQPFRPQHRVQRPKRTEVE